MKKLLCYTKRIVTGLFIVIIIGFLLPNNIMCPVPEVEINRIDPESFWYYPWGESGVHKGIDIFCEKGTIIVSPVCGFIYKKGYGSIAGNYIYIIGPRWRTYYFAHMDTTFVSAYKFISKGATIGKAGNNGNALYKPTHLHYSIETIFPYFWLYDSKEIEGWKKTFYLDPMAQLNLAKKQHAIIRK